MARREKGTRGLPGRLHGGDGRIHDGTCAHTILQGWERTSVQVPSFVVFLVFYQSDHHAVG